MTRLITYMLLLLLVNNSYGQVWGWAEQCYGTNINGDDHGQDIVTDPNGYSYVTGMFQDTVTFGAYTLFTPTEFDTDMFIAKYDPNGNVVWVRQAGGKDWDYGFGVSIDNLGNCYVTGMVGDTSYFETDTIFAPYSTVIFIAKYDTNGNYQWVKTAGSYLTNNNSGTGIVNDALGNIYTTGVFQDTIIFDTDTLIGGKYYVAKFDPSGNCLWAIQDGKTNTGFPFLYVNKIAIDNSGNSYVTGIFSDTLSYISDTIISSGKADIFITKYNNTGSFQWTKQAGGSDITYSDEGRDIVVDNNGYVYVTGDFIGNGVFDTITISSNGGYDVFISKWTDNGNIVWAKNAGGSVDEIGFGLELSYDQSIYITGVFSDTAYFGTLELISPSSYADLYIACYDTLGNIKTVIQSLGSTPADWFGGLSVSSDYFDNVYVTGIFQGSANLGSTTLSSTGFDDILVAKINPLENAMQELLGHQEFKIYPNPTNQSATLEFDNSKQQNHNLTLYDTQGRLIETITNIKTGRITIERNNLPSGLYFFRLHKNNQFVFSGKLILK
jgi:Secretion system C-terminal sorting domain/Beta-propeller repeat